MTDKNGSNMSKLMRLFIATLLCAFLGFANEVTAKSRAEHGRQKDEHQLQQNNGPLKSFAEEPQSPIEAVLRNAPSSHRIAPNRPTRLLPTHGGKPGKYNGRWGAGKIYRPFNIATLQRCRDLYGRYAVAASPRLRYVIALRRLLC